MADSGPPIPIPERTHPVWATHGGADADADPDSGRAQGQAKDQNSAYPSLPESIMAASKAAHAKLDSLVRTRLPRALPPRAIDPSSYVTGLLHMAIVFEAFESRWREMVDAGRDAVPAIPDRTRALLDRVYMPQLMRAARLRADIVALTGWPDAVLDEQLRLAAAMGRLREFVRHIGRSIDHRPHVAISYGYIFFMALLAGGGHISASVKSAGEAFWARTPSPVKPGMEPCLLSHDGRGSPAIKDDDDDEDVAPDDTTKSRVADAHAPETDGGEPAVLPLRFLAFDPAVDGGAEEIRHELERRLVDSESLLTTQERREILQESVCILENMALLVNHMHDVCREDDDYDDDDDDDDEEGGDKQLRALARSLRGPLSARLRDSIAVARERRDVRARQSLESSTSASWPSSSSSSSSSLSSSANDEQAPDGEEAEAGAGAGDEHTQILPPSPPSPSRPEAPGGCLAARGDGSHHGKSVRFEDAVALPSQEDGIVDGGETEYAGRQPLSMVGLAVGLAAAAAASVAAAVAVLVAAYWLRGSS